MALPVEGVPVRTSQSTVALAPGTASRVTGNEMESPCVTAGGCGLKVTSFVVGSKVCGDSEAIRSMPTIPLSGVISALDETDN